MIIESVPAHILPDAAINDCKNIRQKRAVLGFNLANGFTRSYVQDKVTLKTTLRELTDTAAAMASIAASRSVLIECNILAGVSDGYENIVLGHIATAPENPVALDGTTGAGAPSPA